MLFKYWQLVKLHLSDLTFYFSCRFIQYYGFDIIAICVFIFLLLRLAVKKLLCARYTGHSNFAEQIEEVEPNNNLKLKAH